MPLHRFAARLLACGALLLLASPASATDPTEFSLEELLAAEVTSVARQPQSLYDAPAAVYVISNEDIRRSGATSIPEALRLAPGINVARINANVWAITARGFNGRYANKLLVMQDGRSLYNPIFSGVYWNTQDLLLEDIERIEVIRGPVAALWGANAVNGVINIITKSAQQTPGGLLSVATGSEERYLAGARQSVRLNEATALRLYAKGFERDASRSGDGDNHDDWRMLRGGFRLDWRPPTDNELSVQGGLYRGTAGETFFIPDPAAADFVRSFDADTRLTGGHLLGRWQHTFSAHSDLALQLYYDRARNSDEVAGQDRETFDVDLQHSFQPLPRHKLLWGADFRSSRDRTKTGEIISFVPQDEKVELFAAFVQDQWVLREDRLRLVFGTQLEHNDFSGCELQPTLRLIWTPQPFQALWGAVSRAVRTPSRAEAGIVFKQPILPPLSAANPFPVPLQPALVGDPGFGSEEVWSLELGGRWRPVPNVFFDLSLFYNQYNNLLSADPALPAIAVPADIQLPVVANNRLDADSFGVELASDWMVNPAWKLQFNYSYLQVLLDLPDYALNTSFLDAARDYPHHQVSLRSSHELGRDLEFDLWLRYVDDLVGSKLPGYVGLDARLGWHLNRQLLLELVGQNLLDPQHPEALSEHLAAAPAEIERSGYARLTWSW